MVMKQLETVILITQGHFGVEIWLLQAWVMDLVQNLAERSVTVTLRLDQNVKDNVIAGVKSSFFLL